MFLKKKKKLRRNYLRWRYRHDNPACRLLKTSQESCEWLISLRQSHRVLISSPLSLLKKSVRLIRAEKKITQLCLQTKIAEKIHNHFTHRSYRGEHNKSTSWKKKIVTPNAIKSFVCRPEIFWQTYARSRADQKSPAWLTTLHHVKSFILRLLLYLHTVV